LAAEADARAADLASDYERTLQEHGLRCDVLVRGSSSSSSSDDDGGFDGTARLAARLVARGGRAAEWAAADARVGRLEARGWGGLRGAVRLLR
jgi:hypothetical protein